MKIDRNGQVHNIDRSSLRHDEALMLASLTCHLRPKRSLEIGLAEGGSCVAICAARRDCGILEPHLVLDPFQETLTGGAGLLELERLGLRNLVDWLPERSEDYLHEAVRRNESSLDFAFVDGGHQVGQKLTDAFYLDKVLRPGGVIAFHDGLLISTATAVYFLVKERGYSIVPLPPDGSCRRLLRGAKHGLRLGWWYSTQVIPAMCRSLVAVRKASTQ
ncbi:MAG TPA: class I SAM-dependent methyltransferase [Chthoniobacterales bacterium]|nr:class I SAM-dependent methyltransferase [Chthoniobacterales bacterium]